MTTKPLLEAKGLEVAFGGVRAADNVNLQIHKGEFVAIIGPNGSGKTTFLNLCTGYIRPVAGEVLLDGRSITSMAPRKIARQGIARAFQIPQLFTEHTVIENLMLSIAARRGIWQALAPLDRPDYRAEAMELLELLELADHAEVATGTLSEGLRKLADITVAFALNPQLLLLDEPTSGVSSLERFSIMETLMAAMRKRELTALFVEHDMEIVEKYADRVVVWDSGKVMMDGSPDQVLKDPRVLESVIGVA
ncbi:ABC transporter ATP-binding protein [Roseovarius sp. Pro17]|uniref:ABC transporter ATP-binding protein n=1 Tax=Roseovarius sp. Pro17 TaxID=3108175 RepID=UPI002D765C9C|nr:ABC transporter ATP-binding protein [Roseovarius sp. Pro17]